jgi:hypothetical protein
VWLDATGVVKRQDIATGDDVTMWSGTPKGFIRAEIHAKASRARLFDEFTKAAQGAGLAKSIRHEELDRQPILRALSNPIYVDP